MGNKSCPLLTDAEIEDAANGLYLDYHRGSEAVSLANNLPVLVEDIAEHFLGYEIDFSRLEYSRTLMSWAASISSIKKFM